MNAAEAMLASGFKLADILAFIALQAVESGPRYSRTSSCQTVRPGHATGKVNEE